jgi:hypothetical protein
MSGGALFDLSRGDFRTSRAADELTARFQTLLGLPHRYGPARLALGRSLSVIAQPELELTSYGLGRVMKGEQLFGAGIELSCWLSLIMEHVDVPTIGKREFQNLVAAHWHRGIYLLWDDWKSCAADFDVFTARLVKHASGCR